MVFDEGSLEQCRALLLKWNRSASLVGACGSEFVDDPERVFVHLAHIQQQREKLAHRKGELGIPLSASDETIAVLAGAILRAERTGKPLEK